mmetsp:Transcript_126856/g.206236  ORF Transcript_126856/g.206236 Transcript_126856/m.206236 type:complete len:328 (+) Transcript_126856:84-1067(+)
MRPWRCAEGKAGRSRRRPARRGLLISICCLGVGLLLRSRHASWTAVLQPVSQELKSSGPAQSELGICESALAAGHSVFESIRTGWEAMVEKRRPISFFAKAAERAEHRALSSFDRVLEDAGSPEDCSSQREMLKEEVRKDILAMLPIFQQLSERVIAQELRKRLLRKMRWRSAPLRVQEKIDMLQEAVRRYREAMRSMVPSWATLDQDLEQAGVERRFGEIQWGIEDSAEGRALRRTWEQKQLRRLMSERAPGVSVSLDPGLRVMVRPPGMGNVQVYSSGLLGSPNRPARVDVGVMNDGSIADIYRESPVPPVLSVQPALGVNLRLR